MIDFISKRNNTNDIIIECPKCRQRLRVPGNKKIQVVCSACQLLFVVDYGIIKITDDKRKQDNAANEMLVRFAGAYEYLLNTSAEDIAIRTSIYGAYVNIYLDKNFAHDYYLDIVAALCGPFKFNSLLEDKIIMKMLDDTQYGFADASVGWIVPLRKWILSNCGSKCEEILTKMLVYLDKGKGEEIYERFNYITQVVRPDTYSYFPEMNPSMNRYSTNSVWPRI